MPITKHSPLYRFLRLAALASVFCGAALVLAARPAQAQGNAFGAPGQIVITGDFEGHLRNGWELRLHPSVDYFIAPNVSLGGVVGFQYNSGTPSNTRIDLGARVGYSLGITPQVSFWPTAGISYSHFSVGNGGASGSSTALVVNAPFLYHIAGHFFLGAGPYFNLPIDGGGNSYGLQTVVGGWF